MEKQQREYIIEMMQEDEKLGLYETLYTEKEVFDLMCKAFEQGFKKYEVVDAGLEGKETDIECGWILKKYKK